MGLLIETDKRGISNAFRPQQVAVGIQSRAEALAKAAQVLNSIFTPLHARAQHVAVVVHLRGTYTMW
eukprot:6928190-Alexandrium_andersonii.AAC.1